MKRLLPSTIAIAALLAGCGKAPATTPKLQTQTTPQPMPTLAPGQQPADPTVLLKQMLAASNALLGGYQLDMRWFQKKGTTTSSGLYGIAGIQRKMTIEVKQGSGEGTHLLWEGGSTVRLKLAGLLGAVPVTLKITDDNVVGLRGYTLAEINLPDLLKLIADPNHKPQALPGPTPAVSLAGGKLLGGTVRLDVFVSPANALPVKLEFRDAREVVYRIELQGLRTAHPTLSL